jgi:hypothetical protein
VTIDRPRRYHYAFALERVRGGCKVSHVLDFPSRGQADKWSLGLLAEHGDAGSITLDPGTRQRRGAGRGRAEALSLDLAQDEAGPIRQETAAR